MTTTKSPRWFTGRTKLITIASIVAIAIAGTGAVSANMGILDAADDTNVGTLSAAGDLAAPAPQVVDVYIDDPTTTAATAGTTAIVAGVAGAAGAASQEFAVDVAGTVAIATTQTGLRLDSASPAAGWTWSLAQTTPTELTVTFTNGVRTLEFVAVAGADGTIKATVNEPIVTAAAPPASGGYQGDESEDESHDEYEGGEDDD